MDSQHRFTLPPKPDGSPYSIREILAQIDKDEADAQFHELPPSERGDRPYVDHYQRSYRFALALEQLQREVVKALEDPKKIAGLLPDTMDQANDAEHAAGEAVEHYKSLSVERIRPRWLRRQLNDGVDDLPELKAAVNDPLRMARKHVTDILYELKFSDLGVLEKMHEFHRPPDGLLEATGAHVQRMMMLMADNEVMHRQQQGRAA